MRSKHDGSNDTARLDNSYHGWHRQAIKEMVDLRTTTTGQCVNKINILSTFP